MSTHRKFLLLSLSFLLSLLRTTRERGGMVASVGLVAGSHNRNELVPKLEQISDIMQVTSLKNPVKIHVILVPHILNIHILLLDHWR
jgi:hypothetical protein